MVSQNTVARTELTNQDRYVIEICNEISTKIMEYISEEEGKSSFLQTYGRIHYSRDAGQGRAAGKLQRDALCTRGKQGKAPFSNRNLRWHPLVLALEVREGFTRMDIEVDKKRRLLLFVPSDDPDKRILPSEVHKLDKPYCIPNDAWVGHEDILRTWTRDEWIPNWCTIPILEYSPIQYCIECYAVLGLGIAGAVYNANIDELYDEIMALFKFQEITLSEYFPQKSIELMNCSVCNTKITEYPAGLESRVRHAVWKPIWQKIKRKEGQDKSLQLMHMRPLIEEEINHNASSVRYGHRWCNVAMTDHSLEEFYKFIEAIITRAHPSPH